MEAELQEDSHPAAETPLAPPTSPRPLAPRPTSWPMFLGLLTILFGIMGLLAMIGGAISAFLTRTMFDPSIQNEAIAMQLKYLPWSVSQYVAGSVLAILLLVGGIILIRRRGGARRLLMSWAILKIPLVLASSALGFVIQREMFAAMMKNQPSGPPPPAMAAPMMESFALVGLIIGIAWGLALPLFLLVWFNRPAIRNEMAAWR